MRWVIKERIAMSRTVFSLLAFTIALITPEHIVRMIGHSQPYTSVAWAQDATDADQEQDLSSEPDVTPPDLQGTWSGPIHDDSGPSPTLTVEIFQNHNKLKGTWSVPGGGGSFKGKINSDATSVLFKFKGTHGCKVTAPGVFDSTTEISGTYKSKHCDGITNGTFDMTQQ
jgi:hypothetical protein